MTQAYPRFTPVQILEAGERAMAEGRAEYASQFFQHLMDHYAATPEAASARNAMARMGYDALGYEAQGASRGAAQPGASAPYQPPTAPYPEAVKPAARAPSAATGTASALPADGPGQANPRHAYPASGSRPNGSYGGTYEAPPVSQRPEHRGAGRNEPGFGAAPGAATNHAPGQGATIDLPRHIARQPPPTTDRGYDARGAAPRPAAPQSRVIIPSPEKHYIIGRVIAGLSLLNGISGIFAGIVLLYGAITDPAIFSTFGFAGPGQAIILSASVFIGSAILMLIAQIATAIFNAADASTDLARLERYRSGDIDDDDEDD